MRDVDKINNALKEFSLGNKNEAYKKLKKIFNKNRNNHQLRYNLAVIEQSLGLYEAAKQNYNFLIKNNNNYKAIINLYILYIKESNYIYALNLINKLITDNYSNESIIKDKALVLYKLKKYNESIQICEKFLKKNNNLDLYNILGLNYLSKKDFDKSEEIFKKALEFEKNNAIILNSLGRLYHEKRDSKNAEMFLLRAFKINNNSYEIINNLAGFYREEGKYSKSIELYNKALSFDPNNATIINNLAKAYFDIGELKIAEKYCLEALKINPNDGNIQKILSLIYLRQQNYKVGWHYFDGRLNLSDFVEKNSSINLIRKKLFFGNKLKKDSKILVLREQGVGDEILYGTMYKDLFNKCENVTIECDKRLKNLFCNSFPEYKNSFVNLGEISNDKNLLSNYEIVLYAGSLGKYFRTKSAHFENNNYLYPDENSLNKAKEKLKSLNGINIGISWKSFKNRYSNEKSLTLKDFSKIFDSKNCNFINLQYGDVKNEISDFNKKFKKNLITFHDLDITNDFDYLASLLSNLDLFISVSNSTAHLAGSLGVKTLLIKPENHAIFHYWNQPNNRTPWYKTIKIIDKKSIMEDSALIKTYLTT